MITRLPLADVTLLSNVHYYLRITNWMRLVDQLHTRTGHLIIINRAPLKNPDLLVENLDRYFSEWEIGNSIKLSRRGDPAPRRIRSHVYTSPVIKRVSIKEIKEYPLKETLHEFYNNNNPEPYKAFLRSKRSKGGEGRIKRRLAGAKLLLRKVSTSGQQYPILLDRHNNVLDGQHRIASMELLGYESILVRYI